MSLLTGLISYWKFDEANGNAADSQGAETLTNNATITYSAGKLNNAANLALASSQYFSRASDAALSTGNIDYTWSSWIYLATKATNMAIITKSQLGGTTASDYALRYVLADDRFKYEHRDNTGGQVFLLSADSFGSPAQANWYFVIFWMDTTTGKANIQVNNGAVDSATIVGTPATSSIAFEIGSYNGGSGLFMDGSIDETGFWKRTLSASERTSLYNGGTPLAFSQFGITGVNSSGLVSKMW